MKTPEQDFFIHEHDEAILFEHLLDACFDVEPTMGMSLTPDQEVEALRKVYFAKNMINAYRKPEGNGVFYRMALMLIEKTRGQE